MTPPVLRSRPEGCPSDLRLDALLSEELEGDARREVEAHVRSCVRCTAHHAQLSAARERFLSSHPSFHPPVPSTRPARSRVLRVGGGAAVALAVAAAWVLSVSLPRARPGETTQLKGAGAALSFHVLSSDGRVRPGAPGEILHPGDRVRFSVALDRPAHLTLLSLDAAGHVSIYHPTTSQAEARAASPLTPLDSAVELDSTLGDETVLALFCDAPHNVDSLQRALTLQGERFVAPSDCRIERLSWRKEAR